MKELVEKVAALYADFSKDAKMCIRDRYLIADVPERATALHFSILNTAEFDCVVLSHSDKIEDMEPDWSCV